MKTKLTFVLHLYKNTKFLEKCIKSILNQTDKNFQLILIDDNATQQVLDIIKEFDFSKISNLKTISISENLGHSVSYNYSLRHADGDYIFYFGSDTCLNPDFVKRVNELTDQHQNVDIISFGMHYLENKKNLTIEKTFVKEINKVSEFVTNDILIRNRDKIISKKYLIDNKIRFADFKHYSLIFFIDLIKHNPKWIFTNEQFVTVSPILTTSYNIYDLLNQIDFVIENLKDHNSFEYKNKTEIEYFVIITLLYIFIVKMFKAKPNNYKVQSNVLKEAYLKLNDNFPNWKQNKYLNPKNNTRYPTLLHYINHFKPYRYYVYLAIKTGKI